MFSVKVIYRAKQAFFGLRAFRAHVWTLIFALFLRAPVLLVFVLLVILARAFVYVYYTSKRGHTGQDS